MRQSHSPPPAGESTSLGLRVDAKELEMVTSMLSLLGPSSRGYQLHAWGPIYALCCWRIDSGTRVSALQGPGGHP